MPANRLFQSWCEAWALEALRVLKPGGYALVFGGTRTYHRLACGLEDAGFEIRDCLVWLYGSGFPKSLDVSKAIDKAAGEDAARWEGWGTALKPAHEPIVVARKPLAGTVAANVREHGTGAINVDGCRVEFVGDADERESKTKNRHAEFESGARANRVYGTDARPRSSYDAAGRWPANVVLDEEAAALLDEQSGKRAAGNHPAKRAGREAEKVYGSGWSSGTNGDRQPTDAGGASRFFYCAKTSRAERNAGLDGFDARALNWSSGEQNPGSFQGEGTDRSARNHHPTVKPISLMRWLVRLVTPPGGTVIDPFAGSGTTGIACALEGFDFVGIEREPDYLEIARARIAFWREHGEEGLQIVAQREAAEQARDLLARAGQLDLFAEGAA